MQADTSVATALATATWPRPADEASARLGWEHWADRRNALAATDGTEPSLLEFMDAADSTAPTAPLLSSIFGGSPHLTMAAIGEPALVAKIVSTGPTAVFRRVLADARAQILPGADTASLMRRLRQLKRRASFCVALADIGGIWTQADICLALSELAELAIRLTCRHLLMEFAKRGALILDDHEEPERGSGLIVLGMGKLGAGELNYSSDVDLIVLYDDARVRAKDPDKVPLTFQRLARELVRIMEERTPDGYVFRTDLRLRPDPSATPLAVSVAAAETYYGSLAQTWERAAMIKARPIAGDPAAGAAFARFLRAFVWRRGLDFAALEDIRAVKRRIHRHRGHHQVAVPGHDIKLGRGGIREIEFFVQAQQLIFGGRMPRLRRARTVDVLAKLAEMGCITTPTAEELTNAYWNLRQIEHRLQMVDDRQTQVLPDPDKLAAFARFAGFADQHALHAHMVPTLRTVERAYDGLFDERIEDAVRLNFAHDAPDDRDLTAAIQQFGFADPRHVIESVRGWLSGNYRATRSERSRQLLQTLLPTMLEAFGGTATPDDAWRRLDLFLGRLPTGVQLFSLFAANPKLLDVIATIFGTSERLGVHLRENPALLDALLEPGFFEPLETAEDLSTELTELLTVARDYEDVLDLIRRWVHDKQFQAGIQCLLGLSDPATDGARGLTDVAEIAMRALLDRVCAAFQERHGRFAEGGLVIVAMGKLGAREMSIRSDLDLIMIYDAPEGLAESDGTKPLTGSAYYTRLIQRLIGAITAKTAAGALFDVDMRLRPSGNAGPLATSLQAFERYQKGDAWTWEHQALTRARVIAGPARVAAAVEQVITDTLNQVRDDQTLHHDVTDMRRRVEAKFGTEHVWDVKHVPGGLTDIQFAAQFLMLRSPSVGTTVVDGNTASALGHLAEAGLLDGALAKDLITGVRLLQRLQAYIRLTIDGRFDPDEAPEPIREGIADIVRTTALACGDDHLREAAFAQIEAWMRAALARYRGHCMKILAPIDTPSPCPDRAST